METLGDRIRQARNKKGFTQEAVARHFGIKRVSVTQWESGDTRPSDTKLPELARLFGVTIEWLLEGSGSPPHASSRSSVLISSFDPDAEHADNGFSLNGWTPTVPNALPEIDVRLGAGEGTVGDLVNIQMGENAYSGHKVLSEWLLSEDFLRHEAKTSPKTTVVMEVIGDSMSPSYLPGDRVIVDLAQTRMTSDTVYAISDGQSEPQIKRLQRVPFTSPQRVKIISDNPSLETFEVELDMLHIVGRVCGHIARK